MAAADQQINTASEPFWQKISLSVAENTFWVVSRLALALLLFLFTVLFETEIKNLLAARSIADIKATEMERLRSEYDVYRKMAVSVAKARAGILNTLESLKRANLPNPMVSGAVTMKRSLEESTRALQGLRGASNNGEVFFERELFELILEYQSECDTAIQMLGALSASGSVEGLGQIEAQVVLVGKIAEQLEDAIGHQVTRLQTAPVDLS